MNRILVFLIICLTATTGFCQSTQVLAKSEYMAAEMDYSEGDYTSTLKHLNKAIEYMGTNNPKIAALMVKTLVAENKWLAAEENIAIYFDKAKDSESSYREMLLLLSTIKEEVEKIPAKLAKAKHEASLKPSVTEGVIKDSRDGQTYKTVHYKNGSNMDIKYDKTWMAENLNYEGNSFSYLNLPENRKIYGRLYGWKEAQYACPIGWHLPSMDEWTDFIKFFGGNEEAGKVLRSKTGWNGGLNGPDEFNFSVLPGGYYYWAPLNGGDFGYRGKLDYAYFWSSTNTSNRFALSVYVDKTLRTNARFMRCRMACRCIKN